VRALIDLVATLLEAKDKLTFAQEAFEDKKWADAIYHAYAGFVNGAKALLLSENEKTNHQAGIINLLLFLLKQIKSIYNRH
jgi:sulfite reductase (ferredoxin)